MSDEDVKQAALIQAAAETLGQWFVGQDITRKPIGDMSMDELRGAATAAVSGWLKRDSELRTWELKEYRAPPPHLI